MFTPAARVNRRSTPAQAIVCRALFVVALGASLQAAARADQIYRVDGTDSFSVGSANVRSHVSYSGRQTLGIERASGSTTYRATVRYVRTEHGVTRHLSASYAAEIAPSGEQRELDDADPDSLTVLNQPFSAQLDRQTMGDLGHLRRDVPFDFASPLTGSTLHGKLRRIGRGTVSGAQALGVSFDAGGPMRGAVPGRPEMHLSGRIHMQGQAYYRVHDALLVMLDATLTISGNLTDSDSTDAVTIVYRREIRAQR